MKHVLGQCVFCNLVLILQSFGAIRRHNFGDFTLTPNIVITNDVFEPARTRVTLLSRNGPRQKLRRKAVMSVPLLRYRSRGDLLNAAWMK